MSLRQQIFRFVYRQLLERPAYRRSIHQLILTLEIQERELTTRFIDLPATEHNRERLRHMIGIERWGQRRLRVLLGEPLVHDEYDGYRPNAALSWRELQEVFKETRADTIDLAHTLNQRGVPKSATVEHNDAGPVSVGGWLHYFAQHANTESKRMVA